MSYDAQQVIQAELDSEEKLIWFGVPKQSMVFRRSDLFMIPFSLLLVGYAIFWEAFAISRINENTGIVGYIFALPGVAFVALGLYMVFGRYVFDAKKRSTTFYGLTDKRVIIVSGIFKKSVKSLDFSALSELSITENSDLSGTIAFGRKGRNIKRFDVPKFELIENSKEVYNELRARQQAAFNH